MLHGYPNRISAAAYIGSVNIEIAVDVLFEKEMEES
jgi:hypothetical protein